MREHITITPQQYRQLRRYLQIPISALTIESDAGRAVAEVAYAPLRQLHRQPAELPIGIARVVAAEIVHGIDRYRAADGYCAEYDARTLTPVEGVAAQILRQTAVADWDEPIVIRLLEA